MKNTYVHSKLLLESGAINGISLRVKDKPALYSMKRNGTVGGLEAENRRDFFASLGFDATSVARCDQVHGDRLCIVDSPANCPQTDGLVTLSSNLLLAVSVADCVPVLIFDRRLKAAAAVHSGWKGTVRNIAGKAVRLFVESLNSEPEDLVAFVGPSAGVCCYEVGEDVSNRFDREFISKSEKQGRMKLDLKGVIASQLVREGLPDNNIELSESCTICNTNFHSFRRDGEESGRMLAAIGIK